MIDRAGEKTIADRSERKVKRHALRRFDDEDSSVASVADIDDRKLPERAVSLILEIGLEQTSLTNLKRMPTSRFPMKS